MGSARDRTLRAWREFGHWRRGRPFAAGVFLLASGVAIIVPPYATFRVADVVVSITTIGGVSALLIGALLTICGLSLWLRPQFRFAAGVTAMLLSLIALAATNLGGFLVGTLFGVLGAALALAWTDRPRRPRGTGWKVLRRGAVVFVPLVLVADVTALEDVTPARSWTMSASAVHLHGIIYHGIDRIMVDGRPTRTMRFTVDRIEITDMVQKSDLGNGHQLVIMTAPGCVSTATGGTELFVLRLTAVVSLLGLLGIPVDFTPDHPPPLVPPFLVLTEATLVNALVRGATLAIPEAQLLVR